MLSIHKSKIHFIYVVYNFELDSSQSCVFCHVDSFLSISEGLHWSNYQFIDHLHIFKADSKIIHFKASFFPFIRLSKRSPFIQFIYKESKSCLINEPIISNWTFVSQHEIYRKEMFEIYREYINLAMSYIYVNYIDDNLSILHCFLCDRSFSIDFFKLFFVWSLLFKKIYVQKPTVGNWEFLHCDAQVHESDHRTYNV